MKISILSAALILALGAMLAWRDEQQLDLARHTHQTLATEAARLGISSDSARPTDRARITKRPLVAKEADANQVAADLIAYYEEMMAFGIKHKRGPDSAMQARYLGILDRIISMDAGQIAIIVAKIQACEHLSEAARRGNIYMCISSLAASHPQAALTLFNEFREFLIDGADQQCIRTSIATWAQSDPLAALEWFRKNGGEYSAPLGQSAKQGLVLGAAAHDPKLAFQLLGELGIDEKKGTIHGILDIPTTPAERTEYFSAFRDFLAALPDEKSRQEATEDVYSGLTHAVVAGGFDTAVKWVADTKLSPSEIDCFAQALSDTLGYMKLDVSRGQWIEWAGANVPPDKRNELVHGMMYYWTIDDFQTAGEWLNTAADGPTKQRAIRTYAATISPYQPEAAAQWAVTLPAGQGRQNTLKQIHRNWPQPDPAAKAAAAAFAMEHGIQ